MHKGLGSFIKRKEFSSLLKFCKGKKTPFAVVNLAKVGERFDELKDAMPYASIYYAMKANPGEQVIRLLERQGSCFDIASRYELDQLLKMGISPSRMSFGNTIKKEVDIAYAFKKGIRLFATDSLSDLMKIARQAPASKVFFRISCEGGNADWPLSKKFGAHPEEIYHLILKSKGMGVVPYGISFHVGSQQRDIEQWDNPITQCKSIFDLVQKQGIQLKMINMGGGFPASYLMPTPSMQTYAREIIKYLHDEFGPHLPEIIIEPGRSIVGDAGIIVSEIVLISRKSSFSQHEWVFLDIGKFGGLIETIDESIKYPIFFEPIAESEVREAILAGPTCDSMDILYEKHKYKIPKETREGMRAFIFTAGAYTYSYSSTCFNGLPPLKVYYLSHL